MVQVAITVNSLHILEAGEHTEPPNDDLNAEWHLGFFANQFQLDDAFISPGLVDNDIVTGPAFQAGPIGLSFGPIEVGNTLRLVTQGFEDDPPRTAGGSSGISRGSGDEVLPTVTTVIPAVLVDEPWNFTTFGANSNFAYEVNWTVTPSPAPFAALIEEHNVFPGDVTPADFAAPIEEDDVFAGDDLILTSDRLEASAFVASNADPFMA